MCACACVRVCAVPLFGVGEVGDGEGRAPHDPDLLGVGVAQEFGIHRVGKERDGGDQVPVIPGDWATTFLLVVSCGVSQLDHNCGGSTYPLQLAKELSTMKAKTSLRGGTCTLSHSVASLHGHLAPSATAVLHTSTTTTRSRTPTIDQLSRGRAIMSFTCFFLFLESFIAQCRDGRVDLNYYRSQWKIKNH